MKFFRLFLLANVVGLASCSSSRVTTFSEPNTTTTYYTKLPERTYRELGFVEATGSIFTSRAQLLKQLQKQQTKLQGDALVQVRYDFVFWWPHASAVVVKF